MLVKNSPLREGGMLVKKSAARGPLLVKINRAKGRISHHMLNGNLSSVGLTASTRDEAYRQLEEFRQGLGADFLLDWARDIREGIPASAAFTGRIVQHSGVQTREEAERLTELWEAAESADPLVRKMRERYPWLFEEGPVSKRVREEKSTNRQ